LFELVRRDLCDLNAVRDLGRGREGEDLDGSRGDRSRVYFEELDGLVRCLFPIPHDAIDGTQVRLHGEVVLHEFLDGVVLAAHDGKIARLAFRAELAQTASVVPHAVA
jgi:hypothetical protein